MFQSVITVKTSIAILVLLVVAVISSIITYSVVKTPNQVVCPESPISKEPIPAKKRLFEGELNTKNGTRY